MSNQKITLSIIVVIIIVGLAWFFLDHRSGQPIMPSYLLQTASSTSPIQGTVTTAPVSATTSQSTPSSVSTKNSMNTITIQTNKGTIVFETYDADAPKTSANFVSLANKGFYNGLIFHRVINGFMIQGGDPTGTGTGGPGYKFADELNPNTDSYKAGYVRGTVAMANSGPDTNGSQFFIVQKDTPLPHSYTIFGKVVSGMEVVDAIASTKTSAGDRPVENVVMEKVTVAAK